MGGIRKPKKQYKKPRKSWDAGRIEGEHKLKDDYGLKNIREVWKTQEILRKKRRNARHLLALDLDKRIEKSKELIDSLTKYGIIGKTSTIDNILTLKIEDFLERRLQTIVLRKGMVKSIGQARQLITHGHVIINGARNRSPGYLVPLDLENKISFYDMGIKDKILVENIVKPKMSDLKEESAKEAKGKTVFNAPKKEIREKPVKELKK